MHKTTLHWAAAICWGGVQCMGMEEVSHVRQFAIWQQSHHPWRATPQGIRCHKYLLARKCYYCHCWRRWQQRRHHTNTLRSWYEEPWSMFSSWQQCLNNTKVWRGAHAIWSGVINIYLFLIYFLFFFIYSYTHTLAYAIMLMPYAPT